MREDGLGTRLMIHTCCERKANLITRQPSAGHEGGNLNGVFNQALGAPVRGACRCNGPLWQGFIQR